MAGSKKGRDITPHKGGRTERVSVRATPEVKAMAQRVKDATGKSDADLYEEIVTQLHRLLFEDFAAPARVEMALEVA